MTACSQVQTQFADYLDSRLTGLQMQAISEHLRGCPACAAEFESERELVHSLAALGPVAGSFKEPEDMMLRIRVAISQERAVRRRSRMASWQLAWTNSVGPFLWQFSAGLASAVLLLGTIGLLVGMVAHPERASAQDEPLGMATSPRLLYHSGATSNAEEIGTKTGPVVVEAYVNGDGRVYDYRIVTGPTDADTRAEVENLLLFSVFEPARFFGQPVRGLAVLSFSGVSVRG
jgi:hypothetical protein